MAEKEAVDINDKETSDVSAFEELDLTDQMEIMPEEKGTLEPLIILQDEVVSEKAPKKSGKRDNDHVSDVEVPTIPEDMKTELSSNENAGAGSRQTTGGAKGGKPDLDELNDDGPIDLNADQLDDQGAEKVDPSPEKKARKSQETSKLNKISDDDDDPAQQEKDGKDSGENAAKSAKRPKRKISIRKPSAAQLIAGLTVLLIGIAGGLFYMKPSFLGFEKKARPIPPKAAQPAPPVKTVQKRAEPTRPPSKHEKYLTKLADAGDLRDELLEKKKEIHQLKRHYLQGIADLEEQISRDLQKESITSYAQALKNRRIELNLRTIQRRRSYVRGLEKPTRWLKYGSEELLYLKRKAELDLQLIDIAGGVDMDRHMRHIGAAIQKYRPSAQNLAIESENTLLPPLETIWSQIKNQKKKTGKELPNMADEAIVREICSANYGRTAELTSMSAETAQCLSKMNGSDLFLNGLRALSPAAAKHLCQWRGRWICLNGVKELSPASAEHLFKFEGNWISLNGLVEFPPELATYLMEWDGKQLELMGLQYNHKNADQKALKYLALWETMGGKLYVSEVVRKEIERVMM